MSASELPQLQRDRRGPIALLVLALLAGAGGYLALRESPKEQPPPPVVEVKPPPLAPVVPVVAVEAPVVDAGAPPAVVAVNRTPGSLVLEATPWAEVTLDGRSVGETPLGNVSVLPGMHTLLFKNPESGKSVKCTIQVNPGQRVSLRVDLR